MIHTRAKLLLDTSKAVTDFVRDINSDGSTTKWMLENFDSSLRVSARSLLGAMYASVDWNGEIYLTADNDCEFPAFVDKYRA